MGNITAVGVLVFAILISAFLHHHGAAGQVDEARLRDDLLGGYKKELLPSYSEATPLQLGPAPFKVSSVDMSEKSITMVLIMYEYWNDTRLQWNPSDYNNITQLHFPIKDIWRPDIHVFNSMETVQQLTDTTAIVSHMGSVLHIPPVRIKTACAMDLSEYPYDTQQCSVKWGSWAHKHSMISLTANKDHGMEYYVSDGSWQLLDIDIAHESMEYPCCLGTSYDSVTMTVNLKRLGTRGSIAYSVVTAWLLLVVFLVGPSFGCHRVVFGGLIFVALIVLSASMAATVPAYSTTRLGRFLLAALLITGFVTLINAAISRCFPKTGSDGAKGEEQENNKTRIFVIVDVVGFVITAVLLAIVTGALFN